MNTCSLARGVRVSQEHPQASNTFRAWSMTGKVAGGGECLGGEINIVLVIVCGVMEPFIAGPGRLYLMVIAKGVGVLLHKESFGGWTRKRSRLKPGYLFCGWASFWLGLKLNWSLTRLWSWLVVFKVTGWNWVVVGF